MNLHLRCYFSYIDNGTKDLHRTFTSTLEQDYNDYRMVCDWSSDVLYSGCVAPSIREVVFQFFDASSAVDLSCRVYPSLPTSFSPKITTTTRESTAQDVKEMLITLTPLVRGGHAVSEQLTIARTEASMPTICGSYSTFFVALPHSVTVDAD
uniref:Uncharacterized protein n=1 Tax=Magallana gigas TaxID=29159 RepID=K1Q7N9_MAGGI